jgi:hypothetical protein
VWVAGLLLEAELRHWRGSGRRAVLWWRDDDARGPTPKLKRLLALCSAHDIPLALAVVPDAEPSTLGPVLEDHPQVAVIQHGVDHQNRTEAASAGEFAPGMTRDEISEKLRAGWARLQGLPGLFPAFAPPWNDIHPALPGALRVSGYVGLTAFGELSAAQRPYRVDTHLDLMRWKAGVRFRGSGRFHRELTAALALRRRQGRWDAPVGLLTHHLVHDEAAWRFLGKFLGWTCRRPELEWASLADLLAAPSSPALQAV